MRIAAIVAVLALLFPGYAHAAKIAVPENLAPWGTSPDLPAEQRGIYVNLAETAASRAKFPLEIVFLPYGRMLQDVKSGAADYAFGVIGPATSAAGPFTTVVGAVPMVAVARKGLPLKTLADLHAFAEIGYLRGGSCGAILDGDAALHRVAQDSYDAAIRKLAAGRLDAWCSVKAGFTYALQRLEMTDQIGDQLDYGQVKIGFQVTTGKVDTAEARDLADIVAGIVQDGTAAKIFIRYLGAYHN